MNTKTTPSFIKRLDQYLLKNFPVTWSSRIHSAIIYGLAFALLLAIISFIVPNDPRNETIIHYWIVLVSIISLLALIFWLIYLLRFNVFKRYGQWKSTDTLKTFVLYLIITFVIVSWPFVPPVVESIRANAAYTADELVKDINDMNIKICQLERDSIDRRFESDTFLVRNNVKGQEKRYVPAPPVIDTLSDDYYITTRDNYYYIDTARLRTKLAEADSVKMINDSVYVFYESPTYTFVYHYSVDEHSNLEILSSIDLYRQVLRYKQSVNKENVQKELGRLFTKYNPSHLPVSSMVADITLDNYDRKEEYVSRIREKYDLYSVNRRLGNITEKLYRWDKGSIIASLKSAYYITLILSMLILIYRHTTRRTFFLSLLTAVVLSILTGLFIAMMPYTRADKAFFNWIIVYFIIFMILSAFVFTTKTRHVIPGIALNLLVFMTPFMPSIITSMYYRRLRDQYDYKLEYDREEYYRLFKNEDLHSLLAEIGGSLLLIVLLATIYQMAYKKWFSSPEQ